MPVIARTLCMAGIALASGCGTADSPAPGSGVSTGGFTVAAEIPVGAAPHGIRFSADGDTAYVALSGDDRVAVLNLGTNEVTETWPAGKTPLDLLATGEGDWMVTQFADSTLLRVRAGSAAAPGRSTPTVVGTGPSLFSPTDRFGRAYLTSEHSDRLTVIDVQTGNTTGSFPTGRRPYPGDVTPDGTLAFVPNRDAGTVSVIDLLSRRTLAEPQICPHPSGGALTPDGVSYMVACRGSDEVVFLNTASFEITARVADGIGPGPFAVTAMPDGRFALVNNADGTTVSIIDLAEESVTQQLEVGEQPIVIRVHPDGRKVLVSNEVSGTVTVLVSPDPPARATPDEMNEVIMLGMIHGEHRRSEVYGLEVLGELVRAIDPDYVLSELPPDRIGKAMTQFTETSTIQEPRVSRFPEYVDVIFPLAAEMGFEIVPTAGWNVYMSDYRANRLDQIASDPAWAARWSEYRAAIRRSDAALAAGGAADDPRWIHTDAYDQAQEIRLSVYNRLLNDELGPGGWDNINEAHTHYIHAALDAHSGEGKRFLITYGAGHKGWFLRSLRERRDITLLDVEPFLGRIGR